MSRKLDDELRAAFEIASDFIEPPPGLADNARRRSRARLRKRLGAVVACVLVLTVTGAVYAASGHYRSDPAPAAVTPQSPFTVGYPVSQVAVSGRYLYLASNQSALVAAYDRRTGKLVRLVTVPGSPTWLTVGPGGRVWVDVEGDGTPGALLLFSPDLHARATGASLGPVVPTSPQTALAPTQYGLLEVRMPAPGQPGRASQRLVPGTTLGPSQTTAAGTWAGLLDGRVAVQVTNGYGYDSHLVIAGESGRTFAPGCEDMGG